MAKLNKLTEEQLALMPVIRDKWIGKLNKPRSLDKTKAKQSIERLYELSGLKKPMIIFVDSPLALQYGANILKTIGGDQVREQVGEQKLEVFLFSRYGSISDCGRLSFYDFFQSIGILKHDNLTKFIELIDCNIYDMIQLKGVCLVCGLPTLKRDDKQRMHSVAGPAIQRPDGYKLYYIHGVNFSEEHFTQFTTGKLTTKDILNRPNQDQKRAMLMEVDYAELLSGAKVIDTGVDGCGYTMNLYQVDLGDDDVPAQFYEAIDPSKEEKIILRVHPTDVKTCMEAKLRTWKFLRDLHISKTKVEFEKET